MIKTYYSSNTYLKVHLYSAVNTVVVNDDSNAEFETVWPRQMGNDSYCGSKA
jgi:hypothetical protein